MNLGKVVPAPAATSFSITADIESLGFHVGSHINSSLI